MLCNNNFYILHSNTYYGIEFRKILQPFKKFYNFYGYKKYRDKISKDCSFDISWEKIGEVEDKLVDNIRSKNEMNQ